MLFGTGSIGLAMKLGELRAGMRGPHPRAQLDFDYGGTTRLHPLEGEAKHSDAFTLAEMALISRNDPGKCGAEDEDAGGN